MSQEEKAADIAALVEAVNQRDLDGLSEMLHPEGKVWRAVAYTVPAEALKAVGLSE